ncbi:unnamed protein product [Linum tenue]|uniref:peroxidase n=1 Tax=Linum tenue TaxID=586396 RepID=A0AAV0LIH2_9ROSI|nr:unnamed protein product [Linum tenue]
MASLAKFLVVTLLAVSLLPSPATAQLSANFYSTSCPNLLTIVRNAMTQAVNNEARMAASILRLFFHDCFVNGCDASILLDDTATLTGEKNAGPNRNSARGFQVIDTIKTRVDAACNATVSCADILALAARDGVVLLGGQTWTVPLGRRDARTASQSAANSQIPGPSSSLATLVNMFSNKGLSARDMTVLHPGPVRQQLLQGPGGQARALPLRPGAVQRWVPGRRRHGVQQQRRFFPQGLRRRHGQAGELEPADWEKWRGQKELQED